MNDLTSKIIEKLQEIADSANGEHTEFGKGVLTAINNIEYIEKTAEFEEIARMLMKHLGNAEKYHPHHTVIITNSTAELVEGQKSVGQIMDYVPD